MSQPEKEYIERDGMFDSSVILSVYTKEYGTIEVVPLEHLIDIPTVDVTKKIRGKWIPVDVNGVWIPRLDGVTNGRQYMCSNCKRVQGTIVQTQKYRFCPHCSADNTFVAETDVEQKEGA